MPSRLSSLLVRDGLVGVRRMEKAFQRQVIYGGSLDTILLELGMVPEERLCQYLALASGLPPASRAEMEQLDPSAVELLSLEAAQAYRVVPLVLEGEAVRMAVCSPIDLAALEDLADQIDRPLRPLLVPEYRWHLMLSQAYGAAVPQRYAALAEQIEKDPASQPVGRSRTIIVENEPERDAIMGAQPPLPPPPQAVPSPTTTAHDDTVRARANRITEDALPASPRERPPSNSEATRRAGRPTSHGENNQEELSGPHIEVFGPEGAPPDSATVRPAVHGDTPRSRRRRGVTLIGVSPVRALTELGPQGDLIGDADLSPASGIPTHVRGELGDEDDTPPPRRLGGRATELQFLPVSSTTPTKSAAMAAVAPPGDRRDDGLDVDTEITDVEDPSVAPLPPTPPAPQRPRTGPMATLQTSESGAQPLPVQKRPATQPGTQPASAVQSGAHVAPTRPATQPAERPSTPRVATVPLSTIPHRAPGPTAQPPAAASASASSAASAASAASSEEAELGPAKRPSVPYLPTAHARQPTNSGAQLHAPRPPMTPPARAGTPSQPVQPVVMPTASPTSPASGPRIEAALDSLRSEPSFTSPMPTAQANSPGSNASPISQREARELLAQAEQRDDVFLALLRAVRHVAQWTGLLTVQGGVAIGRLALAHPELDTEQISTVLIPLDAPSPIRTAVSSKRLYVGPLAKGDPAVDSMFLRLGGIRPPSLAVLPLVLRERVVAMVVAHRADRDITFGDVAELLPLATLATEAIGRLILRSKDGPGKAATATATTRAPTYPPPDERLGARARTAPPETGSTQQHRAPGQRAERSPAATPPDPDDPEPEPAPLAERRISPSAQREAKPVRPSQPVLKPAPPPAQPAPPRERKPQEPQRMQRLQPVAPEAPPATAKGTTQLLAERMAAPIAAPAPAPIAPEAMASGAAPMALTAEVLIELIEANEGPEIEPAMDEAMARAAELMPLIAARFPGALDIDRYGVAGRPLRAAQYGGLLELLTRMAPSAGASALLVEKLAAPSRDVRFYAAVCLLELRPKDAIAALFERLYDPDFGVRALALEALQGYPAKELEGGLLRVRQALHSDDPTRVTAAANAAAELTDRDALVDLIAAMSRGDRFAEASRRALVSLTNQDFGTNDGRWHKWWEDHRRRHRIEWMIDGLAHRDGELRAQAIAELRRLTGESFGYEPELPKRDRDIAHRRWLTWWSEAGRLRFINQESERNRPTALLPLRRP